MNELRYIKVSLFCVAAVLSCLPANAEPLFAEAEKNLLAVGRENPFAAVFRKEEIKPEQKTHAADANDIAKHHRLQDPLEEADPQLFIKTVPVRYMNSKSLKTALAKLAGGNGSIASDAKTNSLIICDTRDNIERMLREIAKIDKPVSELCVEVISLKFINPKVLKKAIAGLTSEHGSVSVDAVNNSLIICDTKQNIDRIRAEIERADKIPPQVMIEVVIVDVELNDDLEIGVNWDLLSEKIFDISYRQGLGFTPRLKSTAETVATTGNATAFNTIGSGGDFAIVSGTVRNVIHMLQEKKNVEILASPRAMVLSGKKASIKAVEEIPYNETIETSQGGIISSTEFKEVGVTLEVGATITDENLIHLTVYSEQSVAVGESQTGVPIIDSRNARTELLLEDGQIVIMGGLRQKETTEQIDQIPLLGDLPLIGFLFRSTKNVQKNSELIVFLSPHIYKGQPLSEDEMAKFNKLDKMPVLSFPHKQQKDLLE